MEAHESLLRQSSFPLEPVGILFAGVLFRIAASSEIVCQLQSLQGVSRERRVASLPLATVDCRFQEVSQSSQSNAVERSISWHWSGGLCLLTAPRAEIRLQQRGAGWLVQAEVMPGKVSLAAVLTAVATALAIRRGGVVLHCASVQCQKGVIAFIGPSGAGKTTACQHMSGAKLFSIDRLLVAPDEAGGYRAFSLPGGTVPQAPAMTNSEFQSLPLRAIFGLSHAKGTTHVESLSAVGQLALLRQCALDGCKTVSAASDLLRNLVGLAQGIPVARLHWNLGDCLASQLAIKGAE